MIHHKTDGLKACGSMIILALHVPIGIYEWNRNGEKTKSIKIKLNDVLCAVV